MSFIKLFNQISKSDAPIAGGKGASLGEMTQSGVAVPPGFIILSSAFEKFLEETDLNVEIDTILHSVNHKEMHTVENASEKIKGLILKAKMPKNIGEETKKEFKKLKSKFVAVRSSATAEDSSSAAWAGQLDTFLNTTEKTLLENVQKCWASLFTPRAIFYRFEKGLHNTKISVAVVVQKMIESESSGIAFSVHPITQDYNQLIIEAGYGLGEAIVSGQITPDSYVVEKNPRRIIDKNISIQERGLYRKSKDGGSEWQNISKQRGEQQKLTDEQILQLSELIIKIETHYGFPCDIEWAFEKGKFYIVQSRPITTLTNKTLSISTRQITEFLNRNSSFPIFVRPYSLTMILALYDAYRYKYDEETGEKIVNVLIYAYPKNEVIFYEFTVDFNDYNSKIQKRINQNGGYPKAYGGIDLYYRRINNFKNIISNYTQTPRKEERGEIFDLASSILAFESLLFIIPFLDSDLKMEILDKTLLEKAKKARLDSEKFFTPGGELDAFLGTLGYMPPYLKRYRADLREFLVFDNKFIYDQETINCYKTVMDAKQGVRDKMNKLRGTSAYPGRITGIAKLILSKKDFHKMSEDDIIIAHSTTPDYLPVIKKASGIITDEGGVLSHASIVSREFKIPCIVGTYISTKIIQDGMRVTLDANVGIVSIHQ